VGKTRLLLALPDVIPEETRLWYARSEAETIEHDLTSLDSKKQHVIVVDDAHRFEPLSHLRELLVNPYFDDKVNLVLATRSVFSESVSFRFSQVPGDQISEIEVGPLTDAEIDQLLQSPPHEIENEGLRHTLVVIAEGNPLIARFGANLAQRCASIAGLTRDEVLTRYLDELIHDLADAGYSERYIVYLEVLAALGTLDLSNESLRARVQQVVGISQSEEDRIVAHLVRSGLVERYWMTLKIASEVLADHILISHYFDPETKRADYQSQIIQPFLPLEPKQILTNLAEAEIKGESREAGLLLGGKLNELHRLIDEGGNMTRLNVLEWLEDVAYLRPDDALAIVARIVDGPELSPESYDEPLWQSYEVDHKTVLQQAVEITSRTIYRDAQRDAITYLHKLARYQPEVAGYDRVREKAEKALVEVAKFKPHKPYNVQLSMLEQIPAWLDQNFTGNLKLVLEIIQPMLGIQLHSVKTDPTKPFQAVIRRATLNPAEPLQRIRERSLEILYRAYQEASYTPDKLRVLQVLDGAVPYLIPNVRVPDETPSWLKPDCINTARFFCEVVVPDGGLPMLDAASRWLHQATRRYKETEELENLKAQLQDHELYQFYRLLTGWHRWELEGETSDWRKSEKRRQETIDSYVGNLSKETIEQSIYDLDTIVAQAQEAGETGMRWLGYLLRRLGKRHVDLACQLINRCVTEDLALKRHLGSVLAGLRQSAPDVSWDYIESWTSENDPVLWLAVAYSCRFVDWEALRSAEWDILRQLVAHDSPRVDQEIIWLTHDFALHNPDLAVELLKIMADRGEKRILQDVAEVLSWPNNTRDGWAIEFANPQDYLDIIQNFERLSSLDFHIEECLSRMCQIAPMEVVPFLERRISAVQERREENERYNAVPFQFSRAMDTIRSSPQYLNVLRRVRDWMLRDDAVFQWETPRVLKRITGGLGSPLYKVLMEWVDSGEEENLQAVARILREFNEGGPFYNLCREIVSRTDDEATLSRIVDAIGSTPGVISGGFANFSKKRLKAITLWLEDENLRVRHFAQQMLDSLQITLESEEAREEMDRKNWR
jgi:hypothetical protein